MNFDEMMSGSPPFNPNLPDPRMMATLSLPGQAQAGPPRVTLPGLAKAKAKLSLWDKLQNAVAPVPTGMGGLLNSEDIRGARNQGLIRMGLGLLGDSISTVGGRNLGQSLAHNGVQGMDSYQNAINQQIARVGGKQEIDMNALTMAGAKQKQAQAQRIAQGRQTIFEKHGKPDGTVAGNRAWASKAYGDAAALGDEEMMQQLTQMIVGVGGAGQKEPGEFIDVPGPDGRPVRKYITASEAREGGIPVYERPKDLTTFNGTQDQRMATNIKNVTNAFNDDTKNYRGQLKDIQDGLRESASASAGNGMAQVAMVYAFVKSRDPNAVKEGEVELVRKAQGLISQYEGKGRSAFQNRANLLTPAQVRQMTEIMRGQTGGINDAIRERGKYYTSLAKRYQIENPEDLFPIPEGAPASPTQSRAGGPSRVGRAPLDARADFGGGR